MMGKKERDFAPLINVSLEELVPQDHFYRQLERKLDLSFVREFVHQTYAQRGRPSIDPIVFFKLQLVMFFEGICSERQLMRHAADRLSVRWYIGVRRFGTREIAPQEQRVESRYPLGQPPYLMPKGRGENSMAVKRLSAKVCNVMCRKPCTHGEA
jgi:hypothetical protein